MLVAILFAAANVAWWLVVLAIQHSESRRGLIPARRKWNERPPFLYLQDWNTGSWGDLLGLSLSDAGAGYYLSFARPNMMMLLLSVFIGIAISAVFFSYYNSHRHRPDAGEPRPGEFSISGQVHMAYVVVQVCLCVLLVQAASAGMFRGMPLFVVLVGGGIYAASFFVDLHSGRFSLLPNEKV